MIGPFDFVVSFLVGDEGLLGGHFAICCARDEEFKWESKGNEGDRRNF